MMPNFVCFRCFYNDDWLAPTIWQLGSFVRVSSPSPSLFLLRFLERGCAAGDGFLYDSRVRRFEWNFVLPILQSLILAILPAGNPNTVRMIDLFFFFFVSFDFQYWD